MAAAVSARGAFEFNPARHDFGRKILLGHTIDGQGLRGGREAVTLDRAPARLRALHLARARELLRRRRSAAGLVERMAQTFMRTDGDIAAVLRTMFLSPEFDAALGGKFKDPMRFVVSAVRFAYDGRPISNTRPMLNWLNGLGEAPYGHQTPDGYPLTELNWASSGQMSRASRSRAPSARATPGCSIPKTAARRRGGFPQLSNRCISRPSSRFSGKHPDALNRANSQQEWNTFLLSSPDFSYE
jgi:uncharacterized protein (DUF1800 family)